MQNQKFFQLTWDWWEEGSHWTFYHPNKTIEQFKKDVDSLFVKYGNEYLDQEESWVGVQNWTTFIANKMPELGYEPIKPHSYGYYGSHIMRYKYRDFDDYDDELKFEKMIGEELLNRAHLINKSVEEEMNKELDAETRKRIQEENM